MDCKATSIKPLAPPGCRQAFGLTEMLFAMGITTLLVLVVCSFAMFSSRSFATVANYVELDDLNRLAMDQITRDLRQANRITSYETYNNITNCITRLLERNR